MATESGFSTQLKYGEAQHKTIHNLGSQRYGTSVSTKALSEISAVPLSITGVVVDPKDAKTYFLEVAGHGTRKGDVIRFMSGSLIDYELEVVEVVDPSIIKILNVGTIIVGDTIKPMRWVTSKADREGNLNFSSISKSGFTSLDFSIDNVADTAYEEIHASTPFQVRKVQIFMSSGTPLLLAFGAIGSEQDKLIIIPGGNGLIDFAIPEATRLSVKSMSGTVDSGLLLINFLG